MIKLFDGGAYLLRGSEIIPDGSEALAAIKAGTGREVTKEEAAQNTMPAVFCRATIPRAARKS